MRLTAESEREIFTVYPGRSLCECCPSTITITSVSSSHPAFTLRPESAENTTGRENRECEQTGVKIIQSIVGSTTGPPAEREYAVEPVGVAK